MNADDDVRTPPFEEIAHISNAAGMKELSRLWTKPVNQPEIVFHPVLLMPQQPVVNCHQFRSQMMRFFDRSDPPNRVRFAFDEALNAGHDRRGRRTMPATSVGRNDQDFRGVRIHQMEQISYGVTVPTLVGSSVR